MKSRDCSIRERQDVSARGARARAVAIGVALAASATVAAISAPAAIAAIAAIAAVVPSSAAAQSVAPRVTGTGRAAGTGTLVVSVLTMGQGVDLFDRFGHMSIRVRNPATGLDSAWNWGMYDFTSPGFIPRFLTGETRYWMAGFPSLVLIDYYREQGRAVWEQTLDLDGQEADSLLAFIRWTARPENKFYRYDYYLDNCATRVRDALDGVLGGGLRRAFSGPAHGRTWRRETLRLAAAFPLINFAMSYALGPRADAPMSDWDESFIPMRLRDAMRDVRITRGAVERPLVRAEQVLVPQGRFIEAGVAPSFRGAAALVGLALAACFVAIGGLARRPAWSRIVFAVTASAWHLVVGAAGTLVLLAGLFTRHTFMEANSGVLLGTPVSLALAVLIPIAVSSRSSARTRRVTTALAAFTAVAAATALASHWTGPRAPADLSAALLAVPAHVAIAFALHWRGHGTEAAA